MGISMQQHRTSKQKPVPLANILRERRSMMPQKNSNGFNNGNNGNNNYNGYNNNYCY